MKEDVSLSCFIASVLNMEFFVWPQKSSSLSLIMFFFSSFFSKELTRFKAALYCQISLLKCDKEFL